MIIVLKSDDLALNVYKILGWICTFIFILGLLCSLQVLKKPLPKYKKPANKPLKFLEKFGKKVKKVDSPDSEEKLDISIKSKEDLQMWDETKKIHVSPI